MARRSIAGETRCGSTCSVCHTQGPEFTSQNCKNKKWNKISFCYLFLIIHQHVLNCLSLTVAQCLKKSQLKGRDCFGLAQRVSAWGCLAPLLWGLQSLTGQSRRVWLKRPPHFTVAETEKWEEDARTLTPGSGGPCLKSQRCRQISELEPSLVHIVSFRTLEKTGKFCLKIPKSN